MKVSSPPTLWHIGLLARTSGVVWGIGLIERGILLRVERRGLGLCLRRRGCGRRRGLGFVSFGISFLIDDGW
jgi:hypothetical protein